MRLEFEIEGIAKLGKQLEQIASAQVDGMGKALIEAGFRIQRHAKKSIASSPIDPDTGRSTPGNPPHTDTGLLAASIYVNTQEDNGRTVSVIVGTDVKYGQWLEFGTKNIAPRPWLLPAFEATKQKNMDAIKRAVVRVIKDKGAA